LSRFYEGLLSSEARHFEHYLAFARNEVEIPAEQVDQRLNALKSLEADLISTPDDQFRFHSGLPPN
jgi:tRNA-(ms[2]io[6]A)-hydroxylase